MLSLRPDLITLDYALNDRGLGLEKSHTAWTCMIQAALQANTKIILLTPTSNTTQDPSYTAADKPQLPAHAAQIRRLAEEHQVALVDSLAAFEHYQQPPPSPTCSPRSTTPTAAATTWSPGNYSAGFRPPLTPTPNPSSVLSPCSPCLRVPYPLFSI